jgi:hypothetical protein
VRQVPASWKSPIFSLPSPIAIAAAHERAPRSSLSLKSGSTRPLTPCRRAGVVGLFVGWIELATKTQVRTSAKGGRVFRPTYSITVERVFEYALAHRLFLAVDGLRGSGGSGASGFTSIVVIGSRGTAGALIT